LATADDALVGAINQGALGLGGELPSGTTINTGNTNVGGFEVAVNILDRHPVYPEYAHAKGIHVSPQIYGRLAKGGCSRKFCSDKERITLCHDPSEKVIV
jgi:hypothetical protein